MKPQDRTRAILTSRLEPSMRLLLVAIADHMDAHDECWPGVDSIAERSGFCERQTRDLLTDAESRGLIRRWRGEHRTRNITIEWDVLAAADGRTSARGGRREPAKTAPHEPAKTAGIDGGKDCLSDRQTLPPQPAKTAEMTGKDCTRSVKEASKEAIRKRPPRAGAHEEPDTPDPEPPDLLTILEHDPGAAGLVRRLVMARIETVDDLVALTFEGLQFAEGIGEQRALRIQRGLVEHGYALASAPGAAPPDEDPEAIRCWDFLGTLAAAHPDPGRLRFDELPDPDLARAADARLRHAGGWGLYRRDPARCRAQFFARRSPPP